MRAVPAPSSVSDAEWKRLVKQAVDPVLNGQLNVITVTAAHDAAIGENVILGDATAGAFTVTLPSAAKYKGFQFIIKKIDASANAVTIDASETIDGAASVDLASQYDSKTVISDGAGWNVI